MTDKEDDKKKNEEKENEAASIDDTKEIIRLTWSSLIAKSMQILNTNSQVSTTSSDDNRTLLQYMSGNVSDVKEFSDLESMLIFSQPNRDEETASSFILDIDSVSYKRHQEIISKLHSMNDNSNNNFLSQRSISTYSSLSNLTPTKSTLNIITTKISENTISNEADNSDEYSSAQVVSPNYLFPKSAVSLNIPISMSQRTFEKESEIGKAIVDNVEVRHVHTSNMSMHVNSVPSNEKLEDYTVCTEDQQISANSVNDEIEVTSNTADNSGTTLDRVSNTTDSNSISDHNFVPVILHVPHNLRLNDRAEIENSTPLNTTIYPTYGPNVRHFTTNTAFPQNEVGEININFETILPTLREEQNTISRIYEYEITTALYSSPNFRNLQDSELNIEQDRFRPFHSVDTIHRNNTTRQFRR